MSGSGKVSALTFEPDQSVPAGRLAARRRRRRRFAAAPVAALVGALMASAFGTTTPAQAQPPAAGTDVSLTSVALTPVSAAKQRAGAARDRASAPTPDASAIIAELPAREVGKFATVGVTWAKASANTTVQVRTRSNGAWSAWQTFDDQLGRGDVDRAGGRVGTNPLFVGESDAVSVRLWGKPGTVVEDPQLALLDTPVTAGDQRAANLAAADPNPPGLAAQPKTITRAGWGADEKLRTSKADCVKPRMGKTIRAAIVHHTAGSNSYSAAQSAGIVRSIYAYHTKSLGWCDIGYNFLIDKYGSVFEGRFGGVDRPVHGAHATNWNTDTMGVSMMGNFETAKTTAALRESVARVIAWKFDGYYLDPKSKVTLAGKRINRIAAHRDVMQTACPGRYGMEALGSIRNRVAALEGSWRTPIYNRWVSLGGEGGKLGVPFVGEQKVGDGRWTMFHGFNAFSSPRTGAFLTEGKIGARYRELRTGAGPLGFPIADEQVGPVKGAKWSRFERGAIMWSPKTGAKAVQGNNWAAWNRLGTNDRNRLGVPLDEQYGSYNRQNFTGGFIATENGRTTVNYR